MQIERDELSASASPLAIARLEAAFGSVLRAGRGNPTRDRCIFTLVCAYTERLQAQGFLVERVIVRLKEAAASARTNTPESDAQSFHDLAAMSVAQPGPDAARRMQRAANLLRSFEQAQSAHELLITQFSSAVTSARAARAETESLRPVRQRMREERAALRATIGSEVVRLKALAIPAEQIIVGLQQAVVGAACDTQADSDNQLRSDTLDWTLEALFAA